MKIIDKNAAQFELTAIRGIRRNCHVYLKRGGKEAEILFEKDNGDTEIVSSFNRSEAEKLIACLRHVFDIPHTESMVVDALQNKLDRIEDLTSEIVNVAIANLMYENGIKRAVLTPGAIIQRNAPSVRVEATRANLVEYILEGEPLNAHTATADVSLSDKQHSDK